MQERTHKTLVSHVTDVMVHADCAAVIRNGDKHISLSETSTQGGTDSIALEALLLSTISSGRCLKRIFPLICRALQCACALPLLRHGRSSTRNAKFSSFLARQLCDRTRKSFQGIM